jgi:membrane fusion protein (multidrug efflux system)
MTSRSIPFLSLVAAAALVVAAPGCKREDTGLPPAAGSGVPAPDVPRVAPAASAEAGSTPASNSLVATGTTHPLHEAALAAKASGPLAAVLVDEGDRVKKGQQLFRVDISGAALQAQQAKVQLDGAEVNLKAADVELRRMKGLSGQGAVAQAALEQTQLTYDRAVVTVEQAKVSLASARTVASDSVVASPIAGIVTKKNRSVGESVSPGGDAVIVVHDLSSVEVRVRFPELTVGRVKAGDPVDVTFPSAGVKKRAKVDRVGSSVDAATRSIELVIVVPNPDDALKAGMMVEVDVSAAAPPALPAPPAPASATPSAAAAPPSAPSAAPVKEALR